MTKRANNLSQTAEEGGTRATVHATNPLVHGFYFRGNKKIWTKMPFFRNGINVE